MVIILDEASLCTDPALWNVEINVFKPERLEAEFVGTTPLRAVVLVGDHHQGKAVIKSESVSRPFSCTKIVINVWEYAATRHYSVAVVQLTDGTDEVTRQRTPGRSNLYVQADSPQEAFNTFGLQLAVSTFLRTVMTGFPIEGMYEQFRMPELLCALPKRRCYGDKLRTSAAKKETCWG